MVRDNHSEWPPKQPNLHEIIEQTHASKEDCSVLLLTPPLALSTLFSRHRHNNAKTNRHSEAPVTSREAERSVTMTSPMTCDAMKQTAHPCMVDINKYMQ